MIRWLKAGLALLIVVGLCLYLAGHWEQLRCLLRMDAGVFIQLFVLVFLASVAGGRAVQIMLRAMGAHTRFWEMVWLQNACMLLNYLPMKAGTLFRANYLKERYSFGYAAFAAFFLQLTLLMAGFSSVVGLVVPLAFYGGERFTPVLILVFSSIVIGTSVLLFAKLPLLPGDGRLAKAIRRFLRGRHQLAGQLRPILSAMLCLGGSFLATSIRLFLIYRSMDVPVHPAGCLLLGALGYGVMFVSLTPGALGIKELVLTSGGAALGVPVEVGVLASMLDRAVMMGYAFPVGGACAAFLCRRSGRALLRVGAKDEGMDVKE